MKTIDFRSDTVTTPSQDMREAMAKAEVGDDVYGEDPTVIVLEQDLAKKAGKQAGLFMTSGTQSNLVALLCHCERGEEYITGTHYHTYKYEAGGAAVLGGISPCPIPVSQDQTLPLDLINAAIKPDDFHFPVTKLLSLENTVNGKVIDQNYIKLATAIFKERGLKSHLDGARIFNAHIKSGIELETLCMPFDSVSICLSKGLGAPIGSVLLGTSELIEKAKRWRKMLGGGTRQVGILAAAGLYALENNVKRLRQDHENAALFKEGLENISALNIDINYTGTNMVFVTFHDESQLSKIQTALKSQNIIIASSRPALRFVTHLDISRQDIEKTLSIIENSAK